MTQLFVGRGRISVIHTPNHQFRIRSSERSLSTPRKWRLETKSIQIPQSLVISMKSLIAHPKPSTGGGVRASVMALLIISCAISGCLGQDVPEEERISITIAYEVSPNMVDPGLSPQIFSDHISEISNFDITISIVDSKVAMLEALRFGNVDVAYMDSGNAWIGWNQYLSLIHI